MVGDRELPARRLKRLYARDDRSKILAQDVRRIELILAALDAAGKVNELDVQTFHLHSLKGGLKDFWAITVRANWRIIFRFDEGAALDVDLVDYH
jgi:proteic killer suppression protein